MQTNNIDHNNVPLAEKPSITHQTDSRADHQPSAKVPLVSANHQPSAEVPLVRAEPTFAELARDMRDSIVPITQSRNPKYDMLIARDTKLVKSAILDGIKNGSSVIYVESARAVCPEVIAELSSEWICRQNQPELVYVDGKLKSIVSGHILVLRLRERESSCKCNIM